MKSIILREASNLEQDDLHFPFMCHKLLEKQAFKKNLEESKFKVKVLEDKYKQTIKTARREYLNNKRRVGEVHSID